MRMIKEQNLLSRDAERGGITIVVALVLIVLMSLAAFSMSRNAIRQLASSGSILQGGKATEAADAGLDWFIVWSGDDNQSIAQSAATTSANWKLQQIMGDLTLYPAAYPDPSGWYQHLSDDGLLASTDSTRTWDMAAAITSTESQATTSDTVMDNTTTDALQNKNSTGNPVIQSFDLTSVRYLGEHPVKLTTNQSGASGGTSGTTVGILYFQVSSLGKAAIPIGGGNYLRYQQRREMIASAPPFQR